ncbi:MAG: hypothetical protein LBF71_02655 [Campylobacteraceae bacterium]|nr:hypothetical protein [Campylobacteraceae bacterium]
MKYTPSDLQAMITSAFSKVENAKERFLKCECAVKAREYNPKKFKTKNERDKLFVPLIKTTVQILHSIFQTSFMSKKCPIDIDRIGERENDADIRNALMAVIKHAWENSSHRIGLSRAVLSAISLPLGIAALFWDRQENRIRTRFIPITDIAFDPNAIDISDIEYVCYRTKVSIREVRENLKNGFYVLKDKGELFSESEHDNNRIQKDEIYVKSLNKSGERVWYLTTFIHNRIVRDKIEFRELPFHFGYLIDNLPDIEYDIDDNESYIYGFSVAEVLFELQREYNIKRNQKIRLVDRIIDPPRTIDKNSGAVSLSDIKNNEPFIRVETSQGKSVKDVVSVDYTPPQYPIGEELGLLNEEYEKVSGLNSILLGQTSPSDRRAMGALQTVNASSSLRIESMMQTLVDTMLNSYANHFAKLVYYNTTDSEFVNITENPEIINIIGTLGKRIPLEMNVRVNFGTVISEEVKLSKLSNLLQILMQSGVVNAVIVEKLIQDIMVIIQGENAAVEMIEPQQQEAPPSPTKEDIDREALLRGGV